MLLHSAVLCIAMCLVFGKDASRQESILRINCGNDCPNSWMEVKTNRYLCTATSGDAMLQLFVCFG